MQLKLHFPVFVLPENENMIYIYFKERDLKSTSEELLQKVDYTKFGLIDSTGHLYKIKRAFKIKYLGLWGFNPLLKGRQILIDFEYLPELSTIQLNDFNSTLPT